MAGFIIPLGGESNQYRNEDKVEHPLQLDTYLKVVKSERKSETNPPI